MFTSPLRKCNFGLCNFGWTGSTQVPHTSAKQPEKKKSTVELRFVSAAIIGDFSIRKKVSQMEHEAIHQGSSSASHINLYILMGSYFTQATK